MAMGGFEPLEAVGIYSTGAKVPSWGQGRVKDVVASCVLRVSCNVKACTQFTAAGVQLRNS
jgi:hypothetical protein